MQTIKVSATKARQEFFELLNLIALGKTRILIERDSKEVAVIEPAQRGTDLVGLKKSMNALAASGAFKDFDLTKSPLRNEKVKAWLRRIRKY